jgi:hypothetical protein
MPFPWFLVLWAASFIASQLLQPKPQSVKPQTLDFPTSTEDRPIPRVVGTARINSPNVLWYGGFDSKARTQMTNWMVGNKSTIGYDYFLAIQLGLCRGPVTLRKIWINDRLAWSGTKTIATPFAINGGALSLPVWPATYRHVDDGAVAPSGAVAFHLGSEDQVADACLALYQTPCPAYRDLAYVVFNGYIGNSPSLPAWNFEVERIPNGLALADPTVNTHDANPMNAIYELFTEDYGYAAADIDVAGWLAAAATLAAENNGVSYIQDTKTKVSDVVKMIEKQIDGRIYLDPVTGLWKIELARNDYDIGDLPVLDETNIKHVSLFSRAAWSGTMNELRGSFEDRDKEFAKRSALAQDLANMSIQGKRNSGTVDFPGVKTAALAANLTWRELRLVASPLLLARVEVDRSFWNIHVGQAVAYNYDVAAPVAMRITQIDAGGDDNRPISLELAQDVFYDASGMTSGPVSDWVAPDTEMDYFTHTHIEEAAYAFRIRQQPTSVAPYIGTGTPPYFWGAAASDHNGSVGFVIDSYSQLGGYWIANRTMPADTTPRGTLATGVSATDTTIDLLMDDASTSLFVLSTAGNVGLNLENLVLLGSELIAPLSVTAIAGGLRLNDCYRGLCDTAPAVHIAAEEAWVIHGGVSWLPPTNWGVPWADIDLGITPTDAEHHQMSLVDTPMANYLITGRESRPYPPTLLTLNGTAFPSTVNVDAGVAVTFNRRDWRIYD